MGDNRDHGGAPQRDPIYRMISLLMILDAVVGVGLMVYGEAVARQSSITLAGLGLALIGVVLFFFFRALAASRGRR